MESSPFLNPEGITMNLNCTAHTPNRDVFNPHCVRCGCALLDGDVAPAQLVERVSSAFHLPIEWTGRQRGTWIEVEEVLDDECWMWWTRPASNILGFEAVEHPSPEPTGEELSRAFLVEMLTAPEVTAEPVDLPEIGTAWSRRKPTRWDRFKTWTRRNAEREFVSIATPLCVFWCAALWVVLGNDGVAGLWNLVF